MEIETIKQINLITYLALTISCSCLKSFQCDCEIMYIFTPSRILKDWSISLPGTCGYKSMKAWKHAFMPLYCNYQGTWKSGEYIWRYTFIHLYCNYQGTWKVGDAIWSFLSYICTAIIKVDENQVKTWKYTYVHLYCNYQGTWKSSVFWNFTTR